MRPRGNGSQRINHAACRAHARRKLFEVHEATKSPIAAEAIERIGALSAIEAQLLGLTPEVRREARRGRSKPLLSEMHDWMEGQRSLTPDAAS
jgi:hypothetical protein